MSLKPRTFRRVILVGSLASVVLLVLFAYFVVRPMQAQRALDSRRTEGMAAAKDGDYVSAYKLLGQYIKREQDPDPEVFLAHARSRAKVKTSDGGHARVAIGSYRKYLKTNPDDLIVSKELLPLFNAQGMYIEAVALAQGIRTRMGDSSLMVLQEELHARQQLNADDPEIEPIYLLVLEDPNASFIDIYQYAYWLKSEGRVDDAFEMLDSRLASNENDIDTQLAAFGLSLLDLIENGQGFPKESLTNELGRIIGLDPSTGQWESEPDFLSSGATGFIDQLMNMFDRADLSLVVRVASARIVHDTTSLIWASRRLYWEEDFETLDSLDPMNNDDEPVPDVIGYQLLARRSPAYHASGPYTGIKLKDVVLDFRSKSWQKFLDGMEQFENGQAVDARTMVTKAIEKYPSEPTFRLIAGDLNAQLGQFRSAVDEWTQAEELVDQDVGNIQWVEPSLRIINAYAQAGRLAEVADRVDAFYSRAKNNPGTTLLMIQAYATLARSDDLGRSKCEGILNWFETIEPDLSDAELAFIFPEIATLYASIEENEKARALLVAGLMTKPDTQMLERILEVDLRYQLGASEQAGIDTSMFAASSPTSAFRFAIGELARTQSVESGLAVFDQAMEGIPEDERFDWQVARTKYLDVNNDPRAIEAWNALREEHADDVELLYQIAESNALGDDPDGVQGVIDQIVELTQIAGKTIPSRLRLAHANAIISKEATRSSRDRAMEIVRSVVASEQQNIQARNMLGRLLAMKPSPFLKDDETFDSNTNEAIDQYLTISRQLQGRSAQPYLLEAVDLAFESGDAESAKQYLQEYITRFDKDLERLPDAAKRFENMNELDEALALYAHVYNGLRDQDGQPTRDDQAAMNDAGLSMLNLFVSQGERSKAMALFNELKAQAELSADQLFRLASLHTKYGFKPEGDQLAQSGDRYGLSPVESKFVYARYARAFISDEEYAKALGEITEIDPLNMEAWKRLIQRAINAKEYDEAQQLVAQAREHLPESKDLEGLALLASGKLESVAQLLAVGEGSEDPYLIDAAQRVDAYMAAIETQSTDSLITMLVSMLDDFPGFGEIQRFALQELQALRVSPKQIAFYAVRAARAMPEDSVILRIAGNQSILSGDANEALEVAKLWRANGVGSPAEADILGARALLQFERYEESADALQPYILGAIESPNAPFSAEILRVYSRAKLMQGEDPQISIGRLEPLLGKSKAVRTGVWLNLAISSVPTQSQALEWLGIAENYADETEMEIVGNAWVLVLEKYNAPQLKDAQHAVDILEQIQKLDLPKTDAFKAESLGFLARGYALLGLSEAGESAEASDRQYQHAAELMEQADDLDPKNLAYLAQGAYYASIGGDLSRAEAMYTELLGRGLVNGPFSASIRNNLAMAIEQQGDDATRLAQALEQIKLAIETENRPRFRGTQGWIELGLGQYEPAEASFRYVLDHESTNLEGWVGLAVVLHLMGPDRQSEAQQAFDQVVELTQSNPISPDLRKRLQKLGQPEWASVFTD